MTRPVDLAATDASDPLARFRIRYQLPRGQVYLGAAALGPMPRILPTRLSELIEEEWGLDLLAGAQRHGWARLPEEIAATLAPMLRAGAEQIRVGMTPWSMLLPALLAQQPTRRRIVVPAGWPALGLEAACRLLLLERGQGGVSQGGAYQIDSGPIDESVALVVIGAVGTAGLLCHPAQAEMQAARAAGCPIALEVSRAAGLFPLDLPGWEIDGAVGTGAGYLSGGPGAAGFAWLAARHGGAAGLPEPECHPVALASLAVGLSIVAEADLAAVAAKARALVKLFRTAVPILQGGEEAVEVFLPGDLTLPERLAEVGLLGETVAGGVRFSFAPLFLSYSEVAAAGARLAELLAMGRG